MATVKESKKYATRMEENGYRKVCGYVPERDRAEILDYMKWLRDNADAAKDVWDRTLIKN